jgi:hypothetical protein
LVQELEAHDITYLNDAKTRIPHPRGRVGWILAETLNLSKDMYDEWNTFIGILCENHIILE